ncbi:helix-turn-helix domain-containing protein [Enhygromyxa salina]|uniref:helix-turn-helix domain-containing protein n=1 Tax=Enhygromyxa salina TaxID=215803 RepID=UPI0006968107|nr:helix-turn-helix transcriptional regulator [Enhygromyxa salina]
MDTSERSKAGPSELELGRHLRELRQALALSVQQVAARCRLDVAVIRELELGQHAADLDTLRELAGALGAPLSLIFMLWEAQDPSDDSLEPITPEPPGHQRDEQS